MQLRYQRLLYAIFFLAFFIIAPFLIVYASGYRYNFKKNSLEKTGILVVDSQPRKAQVFIDGQLKGTTPLRLTALLPDQYEIRVEKDGYYPWTKKTDIKSKLTTFHTAIVLFLKNTPSIVAEGAISFSAQSPKLDRALYTIETKTDTELKLLNLNNGLHFSIAQFPVTPKIHFELISWSPDGNMALLRQTTTNNTRSILVNLDTLKIKPLTDITAVTLPRLTWDSRSNDILYGLAGHSAYKIDLTTATATSLPITNAIDIIGDGGTIYYMSTTTTNVFINQYTTGSQGPAIKQIKMPTAGYEFDPAPAGYISVHNQTTDDTFIFSIDAFQHQDIDPDIALTAKTKKIVWNNDFSRAIITTSFELWTFDLASRQQTLLSRFSQPLGMSQWYPLNGYVIYQLGNTVRAIDTESIGLRNDLILAEFSKLDTVMVSPDGSNIYSTGTFAGHSGLFQLTISQ